MKITTLGMDVAKHSFSVHGVDAQGKVVLRKTMSRGKLVELLTQLPRCLVGMEACRGAHELARSIQGLGHAVRLMAAKFVEPWAIN